MASWADVEFNLLAAMYQRLRDFPVPPVVKRDGFEEAAVPRGLATPVPIPWLPVPHPWMPAVEALVAAVNAQQLAATVEGPLRAA